MNKKQQELFVAFFEQIFQAEEAFQTIKKQIVQTPHSNLSLFFDSISLGGDRIQIGRMRDYLSDKTTCNERELYQVFQKLDMSRQGAISKEDFIRQLTPITQDLSDDNTSLNLNPRTESLFISLIMEYINRFRILEVARKQVHFIQPYDAYAEIDHFKTGIIGLGELQRFMHSNDYKITQYQLMLLLHGLRRRCYLQINLQVFCQNLDPLQFGQYQEYKTNLQAEKQRQFLKRSRKQQQAMKRSRIQAKKIEHCKAKQQRKKRAQLERQLQIQQRINNEIQEQEKQKQRYIRKAMLQEDKNIRWNVQTGNQALEREKERLLYQKAKNQDLRRIKGQQNDIQQILIGAALRREDQLQRSRKIRFNLERDRQIQDEINKNNQIQMQIQRQRALVAQLQFEKQQKRRELLRQRQLKQEFDRQIQYKRYYVMPEIEASRRAYEQQLRFNRERAQRQYQLEKMRNLQAANSRKYDPLPQSRRIQDLQRELQRTRMQIRQRQNRYNIGQSKRQPDTADRQYRVDRDYKVFRG